ncbi:MAG TPA: ATP-binding protein, partial [Kofleriaceae bacterium]|nr:ATP-binding protein [Kofleriaceae bacterium]
MPSTSPTEMTDDDETARRTALHRRAFQLDAIGRLAGGVAHDFNNILTVIQSYACLLEEALEDRDARREDAAEVRRAAERGTQLTRQLTAMSHKGPNAPRPLDIDDVIRSFLPMMRRLAGPSVAIVHRPGARASVLADEGQVEQVLMNLVVNARDAMPDGGRLVIETSTVTLDDEAAAARGLPAGRHVELSVTDSGVGMDASTCARIFEPHLAAGEAGDGAGLGLSVVRDLVAG